MAGFRYIIILFLFLVSAVPSALFAQTPTPWRSTLYPHNWTPGYTDAQGRFLHDFSYAGYHAGEKPIPTTPTYPNGAPLTVFNVTQSPYNADKTGNTNASSAIQAAINAAEAAGGGIVYLPAGTYRLKLQTGNPWALRIQNSNIVLRGDGPEQTFLFFDETVSRNTAIIHVESVAGNWKSTVGSAISIAQDLMSPTKTISFAVAPPFVLGDIVMIRHDDTEAWIDEHGMTGYWTYVNSNNQVVTTADQVQYLRKVTAVNTVQKTITLDTPTRYYLKTRDNARVHKVGAHISEVGLEHFSIGMRENTKAGIEGETDYQTVGTAAYETHNSNVIYFKHVINGWIQNIKTYQPQQNTHVLTKGSGYFNHVSHIHSSGIEIFESRHITVQNNDLKNTLNTGGGGNGRFFVIQGNDNLFKNNYAENGRHNFQLAQGNSNGNVLLRNTSGKGWHMDDFHTKLAHANLLDNHTVNKTAIESRNRYNLGDVTSRHGITNAQSVFWNTKGEALYTRRDNPDNNIVDYIIYSDQHSWGYIIGTRGNVTKVKAPIPPVPDDPNDYLRDSTLPGDFVEGVGLGTSLVPPSLYEDQLQRRLASYTPTPTPSPLATPRLVAGDVDGDGDVDIFDYNVLLGNFGTASGATRSTGDLDSNGTVDIFDYNIMISNFGRVG